MKNVFLLLMFFTVVLVYSQDFGDFGINDPEKRNILGVGYQVGGQTMIGVDYSYRISDFLGLHIGGGYAGYACGINIYTSNKPLSGYVSLNYEDGGFGLITLATVKWNGLFAFNRSKTQGLFYNIGIAKIITIDPIMEELLFKYGEFDLFPTISIGYGFRI